MRRPSTNSTSALSSKSAWVLGCLPFSHPTMLPLNNCYDIYMLRSHGIIAPHLLYRPQELQLGYAHPDHIVESASLATARPPKIYYQCSSDLEVRRLVTVCPTS